MQREFLALSDGRTLEVVTQGKPQSKALILHHGAFGSSENMAPIFREASALGYFAIGITRPGYAGSSRRAGRRANDYFIETIEVLKHFGINKFVSLGWSSGSPAAISDTQDNRCKGAITISGDAPRDSADWQEFVEKYPPKNPATEAPIPRTFEEIRSVSADNLVNLFNHGLSLSDVEICESSFKDEFANAIRHGMKSGDFGASDDLESDAAPWGIDLQTVKQPVAIFQGDEDRMCTPAHGYFL